MSSNIAMETSFKLKKSEKQAQARDSFADKSAHSDN